MRIPTVPTAVVVLSLLFGACGGEPEATSTEAGVATSTSPGELSGIIEDDIGTVIAVVGDIQIGSKEFESAAARKRPAEGETLSEAEKQEVLQELIDEKMLYLEAKKRGIDRDPKVQKVMVNTLLRKDVYAGVRNSDFTLEELTTYFDEHQAEFVVPEKVQIRRIFVQAGTKRSDEEAKALIDTIHGEVIAAPKQFKEVASEKSEDPYRRRGGDLGFVSAEGKPGIDQEVVDTAFGLEEGAISEPFSAGGGYHIVLCEKRRERIDRTFGQMKGSVLRQVKNDRYKELYATYLLDIQGDYEVTVNDDALGAIEARPARRLSVGRGGDAMPGVLERPDRPGLDAPTPDDGSEVLDDEG